VPCAGGVPRDPLGDSSRASRGAGRHRFPLKINNVIKETVIRENSRCQLSVGYFPCLPSRCGQGPARADTEQFVVTYVEFLPADEDRGEELLEQLAAFGRRNGAVSFTVNQEIQRHFFVLLKIWKDAAAR
jgi:hypothetical protein